MQEKLAEMDTLTQKVEAMEQAKQNGDAAADLLQQFMEAGIVA